MTPEQIEKNREALTRGVNEAFAKDLGCDPSDDVLGLFVDRELARAGILPREVLIALTVDQRAVVLAGLTEDEASVNIAALEYNQ